MFDGIPVPLDVLAPSALCGLFVLLVFTGRLVPKSQVDRLIADFEKQLERQANEHAREVGDVSHDRDEWRAAHRISEVGRQEGRDHAATIVADVAKPLAAFLQGFRQVSGTSEVKEQ